MWHCSRTACWRILVVLTMAVLCSIAFVYCRMLTGGELVYAIDDGYIHLQMARNLAESGVWGIRPNEFAFGSSSPLWTCLLALTFRIIGFHEWVAGAYSTLSCCLMALLLDFMLAKVVRRSVVRYLTVVAFCLMMPVTTAAILGMEHAMHSLFVLCMVCLYLGESRSGWKVALCAAMAVGMRYESLFVVLPLAVAELLQRRYGVSLKLLLGAMVVPLAYGCYAMAHGGCFLPNSLMVKSALSIKTSFFEKVVDAVRCGPQVANGMVYAAGVMAILLAVHPSVGRRCRLGLLACAISVFGHLVFAKTGWWYNINRYEMYLFAIVPIALTVAIAEISSQNTETRRRRLLASAARCLYLLFLAGLLFQGLDSGLHALRAPLETCQTPLVAAKVLSSLPPEGRGGVFLNDLGLIAERTDVPIVDVCGLGDQRTFNLLRHRERTPENMLKEIRDRGVRYAAVYPTMWSFSVLRDYAKLRPVAMATGVEQRIWPTGRLCMYAMTPADEKLLAEHLRNLPFRMPEGVSWAIRPDLCR